MNMRTLCVGFAAGCATMLLAAMTISPERSQDPAEMEKLFMEAMEKYAMPAEQHAELAKREGEWSADLKMWQAPDMPPEIMSGHTTFKMIMDGRYLLQEYTGTYNGMPFKGAGLTAYDRIKKKYINIWLDSMGTGIMYSEGRMKDGVVTYKGKMPDMMLGKYVPSRSTERDIDENTLVMKMFTPGPDEKEFQTMEITYKRID